MLEKCSRSCCTSPQRSSARCSKKDMHKRLITQVVNPSYRRRSIAADMHSSHNTAAKRKESWQMIVVPEIYFLAEFKHPFITGVSEVLQTLTRAIWCGVPVQQIVTVIAIAMCVLQAKKSHGWQQTNLKQPTPTVARRAPAANTPLDPSTGTLCPMRSIKRDVTFAASVVPRMPIATTTCGVLRGDGRLIQ